MRMCMVDGCETHIYTRGLCEKHYRRLGDKVRRQEATWSELVAQGLVDEVIPRSERTYIHESSEIALLYQGENRAALYEAHINRVRELIEMGVAV